MHNQVCVFKGMCILDDNFRRQASPFTLFKAGSLVLFPALSPGLVTGKFPGTLPFPPYVCHRNMQVNDVYLCAQLYVHSSDSNSGL